VLPESIVVRPERGKVSAVCYELAVGFMRKEYFIKLDTLIIRYIAREDMI